MRALVVVVADELGQDRARRWRSLRGISWSRHSRRTVLTQRSAIALARGARIGVRRLLMPSPKVLPPKLAPQTWSRSWIRQSGLLFQGVASISYRQTQAAVGWAGVTASTITADRAGADDDAQLEELAQKQVLDHEVVALMEQGGPGGEQDAEWLKHSRRTADRAGWSFALLQVVRTELPAALRRPATTRQAQVRNCCAVGLHSLRSRATDLFVVQTLTFPRLYVIFFIGHGSRRLVHLPVRAPPRHGGR